VWGVVGVILFACDGGSSTGGSHPGTVGPRPTGVPVSATPIVADLRLGDISGTPSGDDVRTFKSQVCVDGILAISTTREVVYAPLACDRALPEDALTQFKDAVVQIRVAQGAPSKLFLETNAHASAEYTVDSVWLVPLAGD
jgi:hypothetical protein